MKEWYVVIMTSVDWYTNYDGWLAVHASSPDSALAAAEAAVAKSGHTSMLDCFGPLKRKPDGAIVSEIRKYSSIEPGTIVKEAQ